MAIPWIPLEDRGQLDEIRIKSHETPCVIFKHSTRCSISTVALQRLESTQDPTPKALYFFLDLLKFRAISNSIAELYQIHHESPQVLLISKEQCVYEETHLGIDPQELQDQIEGRL